MHPYLFLQRYSPSPSPSPPTLLPPTPAMAQHAIEQTVAEAAMVAEAAAAAVDEGAVAVVAAVPE